MNGELVLGNQTILSAGSCHALRYPSPCRRNPCYSCRTTVTLPTKPSRCRRNSENRSASSKKPSSAGSATVNSRAAAAVGLPGVPRLPSKRGRRRGGKRHERGSAKQHRTPDRPALWDSTRAGHTLGPGDAAHLVHPQPTSDLIRDRAIQTVIGVATTVVEIAATHL